MHVCLTYHYPLCRQYVPGYRDIAVARLLQPPMIFNLFLSHNSVSGHFCKQHGNLYMTAKSTFENLLENAFLIWHCTH